MARKKKEEMIEEVVEDTTTEDVIAPSITEDDLKQNEEVFFVLDENGNATEMVTEEVNKNVEVNYSLAELEQKLINAGVEIIEITAGNDFNTVGLTEQQIATIRTAIDIYRTVKNKEV